MAICEQCESRSAAPVRTQRGHVNLCSICRIAREKAIYQARIKWNRDKRKLGNKIFDRDGYKCVVCGAGKNLTIDHIIPLVYGGSNEESNLQTMCGKCNTSKGAR